ncbi:MAG: PilZ domain-containing protein [Candidatus Gastranaerophilaceae bacterium]
MSELLEKEQVMNIVPQNFKNSNKGRVIEVQDGKFLLEVFHEPDGILPNKLMEFYSQTKNGMLYFVSSATDIDGNIITVSIPGKHRFLQRRAFTRIKLAKNINCKSGKNIYKIALIDLSAGGIKFKTDEHLNIDIEYDLSIPLLNGQNIKCKLQLIRIEKNEDKSYTLSGRFKKMANIDKMTLVQFCMRKNIENANK